MEKKRGGGVAIVEQDDERRSPLYKSTFSIGLGVTSYDENDMALGACPGMISSMEEGQGSSMVGAMVRGLGKVDARMDVSCSGEDVHGSS